MTDGKPFQAYYAESVAHCYGCGTLNQHGLHIESFWQGSKTICKFTPEAYHTAIPGFVYGGLIASLIDCHSIGSASAAVCRLHEQPIEQIAEHRFVTASLQVDYKAPTPIGLTLWIESTIEEVKPHKVTIHSQLHANETICALGKVIALKMPDSFKSAD